MKTLLIRHFIILIVAICSLKQAAGQNLSAAARRPVIASDLLNGFLIAKPPTNLEGNIYFNTLWSTTTITLATNDQVIDGIPARYNLYFNELDVRTSMGERALDASIIKSFVLKDSLAHSFINASHYKIDGVPFIGFLEVLVDGKLQLLKHYTLDIKAPDWNPALNAGSRNTRITKHDELFFSDGKDLIKVKSKKKLLASFGDKASAVEIYLKSNTLAVSEEQDLIKIFEYYNSL